MIFSCFLVFALLTGFVPHDVEAITPRETIMTGRVRSMRAVKPCRRCYKVQTARSRSSVSTSSSSVSSTSISKSSLQHSSLSATSSVAGETLRSHVFVLGRLSPALASVRFFSNSEPVDIHELLVTFSGPVPSIGSLVIYNQSGAQIGTATAVSGSSNQFRGSIGYSKLFLPYREERGLFIKARLKSKDTGGASGEDIQVQTMTIEGDGRWTNETYTSSSHEMFNASETAFGKITSITNAGAAQGTLVSGSERILADLVFNADTPESQHQVRLTSLVFTIEQAGGVDVTNVTLRNEDNSISSPCTVSSLLVTCAAIDAGIGTIDMSRRIKLVGDVSVPNNAINPSLRLVLNDPGTSATVGAITWTDGSASLTWVDLEQPIGAGTRWR